MRAFSLPPAQGGCIVAGDLIGYKQLVDEYFNKGVRLAAPALNRRKIGMKELSQDMRASALVMKITGWGILVGLPLAMIIYAPGFFWGELPEGFPLLGPEHPPSHLDGIHPYLFMLFALYAAWAILLIRGAKDPRAAASLFDWGILANLLHGLLMIVQAFTVPNEHAHMWADIPLLFIIVAVMWYWHPNRKAS